MKSRTIGARNGDQNMEKNEIRGYEPLVEELKQLIHKKQYHVLKVINAETINLYWEIGEEIYKQQQEKGWGKSIVQVLSRELQKDIVIQKNSHQWCEKLAGAIILLLWRNAKTI